ncbi:MAG TPA: glycosyltransferase family 4 protein, partial [Lacipirellulaceae bacterium]|nr:glycosyltransferase family 4 protein [Lacipirellulaceae bacterium]
MMRVAYVCADPGVPVFGIKGCSIHVQEILRALLQRGAQIDLFAYRVGGVPPVDLEGIAVHEVPVESSVSVFRRERNLLYANKALGTLLSKFAPFDLVYERYALLAYAATAFARENGIRSVLEINAPLVDEQSAHRELLDRHTAEVVSAKAICTATAVIAVSQQVAEYALQSGSRASRVHVVPNGVRPERYRVQRTKDKPQATRLRIGFLGSLRPWHGVADLIEAFEQIEPAPGIPLPELCIVGDGPQRDALEEQASLLPVEVRERIQFAGAVNYQEVPDMLASFDVAVAPYTDEQHCYFSPLKVFEYMAAGLPIVAANAGQLREIIRDGENGVLYRPADIASMSSQLRRLLSDEILRNAL